LKRLREVFAGKKGNLIKPQEFHQLVDKIESSLSIFETHSNDAVMRYYMKTELPSHSSAHSLSDENLAYIGSDHEHVFLVYL